MGWRPCVYPACSTAAPCRHGIAAAHGRTDVRLSRPPHGRPQFFGGGGAEKGASVWPSTIARIKRPTAPRTAPILAPCAPRVRAFAPESDRVQSAAEGLGVDVGT